MYICSESSAFYIILNLNSCVAFLKIGEDIGLFLNIHALFYYHSLSSFKNLFFSSSFFKLTKHQAISSCISKLSLKRKNHWNPY